MLSAFVQVTFSHKEHTERVSISSRQTHPSVLCLFRWLEEADNGYHTMGTSRRIPWQLGIFDCVRDCNLSDASRPFQLGHEFEGSRKTLASLRYLPGAHEDMSSFLERSGV